MAAPNKISTEEYDSLIELIDCFDLECNVYDLSSDEEDEEDMKVVVDEDGFYSLA